MVKRGYCYICPSGYESQSERVKVEEDEVDVMIHELKAPCFSCQRGDNGVPKRASKMWFPFCSKDCGYEYAVSATYDYEWDGKEWSF
tara:strand:- start:1050 stop:1310 length:261 start_codon:yes stop_codon:yes gene_type:complete